MAIVLRNVGPPWQRSTGAIVPAGGQFTPSAVEYEAMVRRQQIGIRFIVLEAAPTAVPAAPPAVEHSDAPASMGIKGKRPRRTEPP